MLGAKMTDNKATKILKCCHTYKLEVKGFNFAGRRVEVYKCTKCAVLEVITTGV